MRQGSLRSCSETKQPPSRHTARWILKLARTIEYVHSKTVIISDIASENTLQDDDLATENCDFSYPVAMPLDADVGQAEDLGLRKHTDIFQFGSLAASEGKTSSLVTLLVVFYRISARTGVWLSMCCFGSCVSLDITW